ncbi:SRPBCC family protein [Deinococcus yunweiensis]|uniref:SRPBCC family protein n=1 Tax=Deinococcus yunweiensis TaxID=367282 RepID=UPI00398E76C9
MVGESDQKRVDSASRIIRVQPDSVYSAWTNPEALMSWLPPEGMRGRLDEFDLREGGTYRMTLTYTEADDQFMGKSSAHSDVVQGRFQHLVPNQLIVQLINFESKDPAFAGTMTMKWIFNRVPEGTEVKIECKDVPEGIRREDHITGLNESLKNLAHFVEKK